MQQNMETTNAFSRQHSIIELRFCEDGHTYGKQQPSLEVFWDLISSSLCVSSADMALQLLNNAVMENRKVPQH